MTMGQGPELQHEMLGRRDHTECLHSKEAHDRSDIDSSNGLGMSLCEGQELTRVQLVGSHDVCFDVQVEGFTQNKGIRKPDQFPSFHAAKQRLATIAIALISEEEIDEDVRINEKGCMRCQLSRISQPHPPLQSDGKFAPVFYGSQRDANAWPVWVQSQDVVSQGIPYPMLGPSVTWVMNGDDSSVT